MQQTRLNAYLRSDPGRAFVNGLDQQQIAYKWDHVGQPLSEIEWLQQLRRTDATQAAEIVALRRQQRTARLIAQNLGLSTTTV